GKCFLFDAHTEMRLSCRDAVAFFENRFRNSRTVQKCSVAAGQVTQLALCAAAVDGKVRSGQKGIIGTDEFGRCAATNSAYLAFCDDSLAARTFRFNEDAHGVDPEICCLEPRLSHHFQVGQNAAPLLAAALRVAP